MDTYSNQGERSTLQEHPSGEKIPPPPERRRKTMRRSLALVAIMMVMLLSVVWWVNHKESDASSGGERRGGRRSFFGSNAAVPVVVQTAQKGEIDISLNGLGTVTPLANVTVRTRISGQLTEIHFQEGQRVNEGDLLAVIDPRPYQVALEQAEGQLIQAQAQLKQAQSQLARYETLSKQDSIAAQQVDTARALVNQYEGLVVSDQAAIDNTKLNLTYCHVTAPITGRVGLRPVDVGNYVTQNDANGLVTLTEMKPISVIFTLPEDEYSRVASRLHAGASIPIDAFDSTQTQKLATGTLTAIDNQADTSTGTFRLRATFPNEDELLFPNEFVNVRMLLDVERDVIVIPSSAIEQGQLGTYVYVIGPDDKAQARPVTLGPTQGERLAVASGLAVGDRVVIDGADRLKEGGLVTVQQAGSDATRGPAQPGNESGEKSTGRRGRGGSAPTGGEHARPPPSAGNSRS